MEDTLSPEVIPLQKAAPLPRSFIDRVILDSEALQLSLLHDSVPEATLKTRDLSDRLLLDATPESIETLRSISRCGAPRDRIAAASKLLDKSPATRDPALFSASGASTLSDSAMSSLMTGLSSFLKFALDSSKVPSGDQHSGTSNYRIIEKESSVD